MATIVTFKDIKKLLDLNKDRFSDYPELQVLANSVHASLENYVGRTLTVPEKRTESGFVSGTTLDLKNIPIVSITSVKLGGIQTEDYTITQYGIDVPYAVSGETWEVISKGGFKTIPEDIYRAEIMQLIYEYQNLNNLATKSMTNDSGSTQTTEGFVILKDVKRLLEPYKHVSKYGF